MKKRTKAKDEKEERKRQRAERDELFMSCPRRGQLWQIDTR